MALQPFGQPNDTLFNPGMMDLMNARVRSGKKKQEDFEEEKRKAEKRASKAETGAKVMNVIGMAGTGAAIGAGVSGPAAPVGAAIGGAIGFLGGLVANAMGAGSGAGAAAMQAAPMVTGGLRSSARDRYADRVAGSYSKAGKMPGTGQYGINSQYGIITEGQNPMEPSIQTQMPQFPRV